MFPSKARGLCRYIKKLEMVRLSRKAQCKHKEGQSHRRYNDRSGGWNVPLVEKAQAREFRQSLEIEKEMDFFFLVCPERTSLPTT